MYPMLSPSGPGLELRGDDSNAFVTTADLSWRQLDRGVFWWGIGRGTLGCFVWRISKLVSVGGAVPSDWRICIPWASLPRLMHRSAALVDCFWLGAALLVLTRFSAIGESMLCVISFSNFP